MRKERRLLRTVFLQFISNRSFTSRHFLFAIYFSSRVDQITLHAIFSFFLPHCLCYNIFQIDINSTKRELNMTKYNIVFRIALIMLTLKVQQTTLAMGSATEYAALRAETAAERAEQAAIKAENAAKKIEQAMQKMSEITEHSTKPMIGGGLLSFAQKQTTQPSETTKALGTTISSTAIKSKPISLSSLLTKMTPSLAASPEEQQAITLSDTIFDNLKITTNDYDERRYTKYSGPIEIRVVRVHPPSVNQNRNDIDTFKESLKKSEFDETSPAGIRVSLYLQAAELAVGKAASSEYSRDEVPGILLWWAKYSKLREQLPDWNPSNPEGSRNFASYWLDAQRLRNQLQQKIDTYWKTVHDEHAQDDPHIKKYKIALDEAIGKINIELERLQKRKIDDWNK